MVPPDDRDVTEFSEEEFLRLYPLLRRVARAMLRTEPPGKTLDATAFVHEVYLRLADTDGAEFQDDAHFRRTMITALRHAIVDRARRRGRQRRGGDRRRVPLDSVSIPILDDFPLEAQEAIDRLLDRLATLESEQADIFLHRAYLGLTTEETARALGLTVSVVRGRHAHAQAWLRRRLRDDDAQAKPNAG